MKKFLMIFSLFLIAGALALAQTVQISGTVTSSEDGLPLPGVAVTVRGTTLGVSTNASGLYVISVPVTATTLSFQFIGYKTLEVPIAGQTTINVKLEQDLFAVDEVVVVAYGVQQRRDVSGSISSVRGDNIRLMPVQSFDQALQGKASGVIITMPNGVLNNPPVIRVRGFNSISGSSYPLIVVDGVPIWTGDISQTAAAANTLADINPNDIASIDILKDASATAIYGSRAANGVMIITTKRGAKGAAKVTYDGSFGYTQPYRLFEVMNAAQYIEHKTLALTNAGLAPRFFLSQDANGNDIDTKWSDYVYQTGFQHNHSLSVSGATEATSYFLSIGYSDMEGMIQKNTYNRTNARLNLDHKVNKYLSMGANISIINNYNAAPNTGSIPGAGFNTAGAARLAFVTAPIVGPYNNDGTYNINTTLNQIGRGPNLDQVGFNNPVVIFDKNKFSSESDRLLGTVYFNLEPIKGLVLRTAFGVDNIQTENISFQTPIHGDGVTNYGNASNSFDRRNRWNWTNTISYSTTLLEKANIALLAGFEEQYTTREGWGGSRSGVADLFFETYQGSWTVANQPGGLVQTENYFLSYFGRFNFNWDRKYYFEFSGRRDGYSGLAAGKKFGNFGGASAMWNVSREEFVANSILADYISDLRLKASYGRVGNNSGIDDFGSLFLYSAGVYAGTPTLFFSQAGNADLRWEASNKYDVGIAFGLLGDRLQFGIDWYYNDINDLILNVPQAPSKGIPGNSIPQNIGRMLNTGVDLTLTTYNITTPDFKWTTTLNFSTLKNEVTELAPGIDDIPGATSGLETTNRTLIGYPIGMIYGVETAGVDPQTGRRIFINGSGQKVFYNHASPVADRWKLEDGTNTDAISLVNSGKPLGSAIPKFFGGIDNNFSYRNFDMVVGLTYALDFYVYNGSKAGLRDQRFWNNSVEVYNTAWKQPGDITDIPRPVYGDNISNGSSMVQSQNVERGDYLKVRSLGLGYTIKSNVLSNIGISNVRIYSQLFNAFVFTKYTGTDPEVSTNGNANLTPGVDRNSAPQARTYSFGINLSF